MSTFILSCGGTGGHLSPGIALAQELIERGHTCCLLISQKEVDSRLMQGYPELEYMRMPGVAFSTKPWKFLKFLYCQIKALFLAFRILMMRRPHAIIGFGGFVTPAMILAGWICRCPRALHEANRIPGKAIRVLSFFANRIYLPEGIGLKSLLPQQIRHYGFPVRKEIKKMSKSYARKKLNVSGKVLLVLGGSQGSMCLNEWVLKHFEILARHGINIYCVTGLKMGAHGNYEHKDDNGHMRRAIFVPFVDNMSYVLNAADLVVARAGAGSIAEFIHTRTPSILIPYPYAAFNHQQANASFLERCGGALVVSQKNIDTLLKEVLDCIFNDALLHKMQDNLSSIDRLNARVVISNDLEALSKAHAKRSHGS